MASRLDIAVILALVAGAALWIEQGHWVVIDAPTPSELATPTSACAENDDVPYTASCLAFLFGKNWRSDAQNAATTSDDPAREFGTVSLAASSACPDRDDVPYSAGCLAFLQGATTLGMHWRITAPSMWAPVLPPVASAENPAGLR
jgi:hypothetical protein